jgi:hypothetical protein
MNGRGRGGRELMEKAAGLASGEGKGGVRWWGLGWGLGAERRG